MFAELKAELAMLCGDSAGYVTRVIAGWQVDPSAFPDTALMREKLERMAHLDHPDAWPARDATWQNLSCTNP
jgi:hypothetical protein